jgi:hypothetical protein
VDSRRWKESLKSYSYRHSTGFYALTGMALLLMVLGSFVLIIVYLRSPSKNFQWPYLLFPIAFGLVGMLVLWGANVRIDSDEEGLTGFDMLGQPRTRLLWSEIEVAGHKVHTEGGITVLVKGNGKQLQWSSSISSFGELTSEVSQRTGIDLLRNKL